MRELTNNTRPKADDPLLHLEAVRGRQHRSHRPSEHESPREMAHNHPQLITAESPTTYEALQRTIKFPEPAVRQRNQARVALEMVAEKFEI